MARAAEEIKDILKQNGVAHLPVGVDLCEPAMLFELQKAGLEIVDGQQVMLDAREIKSMDEIMLLNTAASMVDGVYDMIFEKLRPGVRESDIVAMSNKMLYEMGSDDVEAINAVAGERCSPHPHNFTDRLIRPGDQAFFDIIQAFMGYRTCYYRTFNVGRATDPQRDAYKKARVWMDDALALVGFSQGTMMALHVALGRDRPVAALVGYSGALAGPEAGAGAAAFRSRPPVMLIHGDSDDLVPVESHLDAVEKLRAGDVTVSAHVRPGLGHGIDDAGLVLGGTFLAAALSA